MRFKSRERRRMNMKVLLTIIIALVISVESFSILNKDFNNEVVLAETADKRLAQQFSNIKNFPFPEPSIGPEVLLELPSRDKEPVKEITSNQFASITPTVSNVLKVTYLEET